MRAMFETIGEPPPRLVAGLDDDDARLLWALRRLALMAPLGWARCRTVHIVLSRDFGEAGMGIEHLLRCLLVGLARLSDRPVVLGTPTCAVVTGDEEALLSVLARPDRAAVTLMALAGPAASQLQPLCEAIQTIIDGRHAY